MRILHYSLGFPPYRTGGLTKFCMDLMKEQLREKNIVALVWPGSMSLIGNKTSIKNTGKIYGIQSWEILNPIPVSYDEGIKNIDLFMASGDYTCYEKLLDEFRPDVVHFHTLMGLHSNFLVAAKNKGIRLVFSAHDFFPICSKVLMFRDGWSCDSILDCKNCAECNTTALNIWKISILQSKLYRKIKNYSVIKKLRKGHRDTYLSKKTVKPKSQQIRNNAADYLRLREHYSRLLDYMDIIHYNSTNTKMIYETYMKIRKSVIISITHDDIRDNRKIKEFSTKKLKISYLGPYGEAKGFFWLKAALDDLWIERQDFFLNVFFQMVEKPPYIKTHNSYNYFELEKIFNETDILVAPSIWHETFGYTVLEAMSYGVPVIITENIGAKDIVPEGAGIIIKDMNKKSLIDAINSLTNKKLIQMNRIIVKNAQIMMLDDMSAQIMQKCYGKKL